MPVTHWKKIADGMETAEFIGHILVIRLCVEEISDDCYVESLCKIDDEDYIEIGEATSMKEAKEHLIQEATKLNHEENDKRVKSGTWKNAPLKRGRPKKKRSAKTSKATNKANDATSDNEDDLSAYTFDELFEDKPAKPKRRGRKRTRKPRPKDKGKKDNAEE